MSKASDVMTQSLATCTPEDTAAHVAAVMRDRDIGNILVVENGKLQGIVTDRDLAMHALADSNDPAHTPINKFMNTKVVTGEPDWSLNRVARTMAKHQIRRLPIMQDGQLVGIISLGDLARRTNQKSLVHRSLKAISTSPDAMKANGSSNRGAILGLSLLAMASTAVALLTWNRSGKELRKQVADTKFYHSAQQAVSVARDKVDEAVSSKPVRNIRQQVRSNIKEISEQLPSVEYKPARRKFTWFR